MPWAAAHDAFCEPLDAGRAGFLLALVPGKPYPLAAISELRQAFPQGCLAATRGTFSLDAEKVFDSVRWSLGGRAKEEALSMLALARPGSLFVTEGDYADMRQHVKIQLIGEAKLSQDGDNKKIFNILEVF
jgi:hypothetical protein